jgi:hypothetical protein
MDFANTHMANAHRFALAVHDAETENAGRPFGAFIEGIMAHTVACVMSSVAAVESHDGLKFRESATTG